MLWWDSQGASSIYLCMSILARNGTVIEATVRSAASGDEAAFASLVAEHHASMARVAFVVCGEAETTQDAVQAAWAIAWRRLGSLREPAQVRPWLVAIAANEARQAVRRRRRANVVDISRDLRDPAGDPTASVGLVDLEVALGRLRPEERSLIAMRYAAGLDSSEIAPQLGLSASGVRSRLARILDRLRIELETPMEPPR
jgi:RNA polymerase sigma-70 factor (ECF subfamily)